MFYELTSQCSSNGGGFEYFVLLLPLPPRRIIARCFMPPTFQPCAVRVKDYASGVEDHHRKMSCDAKKKMGWG